MMKSRGLVVGGAVGIGALVAAATGLVDVTPTNLVGARWYGLPLTWLRRLILAPQYYPWRVDALNLTVDVVFWCALAAVVAWVALKLRPGA